MAGQEMGIAELAEAAGVSIRTVRFYISLGMLDSPEGRGRSATYSAEHLERLRLIRTLADQGVSLKEIQATVRGLGPEEVRDLLDGRQRQSSNEAAARDRSPRDYVTALLERAKEPPPMKVSSVDFGSALMSPSSPILSAPPPPQARRATKRKPAGQRWRRVVLAPGLELHVLEEMEAETKALVERILTITSHGGTE